MPTGVGVIHAVTSRLGFGNLKLSFPLYLIDWNKLLKNKCNNKKLHIATSVWQFAQSQHFRNIKYKSLISLETIKHVEAIYMK